MHGGLSSLADSLQIDRIGPMHQAGSDSLLTAQTFFALVKKHFHGTIDDAKYVVLCDGLFVVCLLTLWALYTCKHQRNRGVQWRCAVSFLHYHYFSHVLLLLGSRESCSVWARTTPSTRASRTAARTTWASSSSNCSTVPPCTTPAASTDTATKPWLLAISLMKKDTKRKQQQILS